MEDTCASYELLALPSFPFAAPHFIQLNPEADLEYMSSQEGLVAHLMNLLTLYFARLPVDNEGSRALGLGPLAIN